MGAVKKLQNNSDHASGPRIALSIALITGSAILLALAVPSHANKAPRQMTATAQVSRITAPSVFKSALPTTVQCGRIAFVSLRSGNSSEPSGGGNFQIYAMNADGSNQTRVTNDAAADQDPSFSGDGSKIAFRSTRDGNTEIYVTNADGSNQTRLTNNTAADLNPSFSGDGSKIAFSSNRDGNFEIYVMNADGSNQTRLTNNAAEDTLPSFSGDGSKITFTSRRDGPYEIYVMNTDGSNQTRLTNTGGLASLEPSFSGDGRKIAFGSNRTGGNEQIYVMNADGSNQTQLTNDMVGANRPSFSRDGSKIAFATNRDGNNEIYVMNADGSNQTRLTNNTVTDVTPSFGAGCLQLIGLEITQGVQDLNNSVNLVEHKKTVVRAHVKDFSTSGPSITSSATLTAKDVATGTILGTISDSNVGGTIVVPRFPGRMSLDDSFFFEVPPAWRRATVEFGFSGNPVGFACPTSFSGACKATVTFHPTTPLSTKFLRLTYNSGGIDHTPTDADVARVKKEFLGRYPISSFDAVVQSTRTRFDACVEGNFPLILAELNDMRNSDCRSGPCKDFYQGLLADQSSCGPSLNGLNGEGDLPGHASAVFVITGDTSPRIHEQGHVLGLTHTQFTGNEVCENFLGFQTPCTRLEGDGTLSLSKAPYSPATVYGFDVNGSNPGTQILNAYTADFMSYGRPRWPSRVNYGFLFDKFVAAGPIANIRSNKNAMSASQTVIVDGKVQWNGPTGQIGSVIVNTTPVAVSLPAPGDYSIRLEDSQGMELARFSFNPILGSENQSTGVISLLLPWDPNAKRIVLLHNENILDSRQASAHSPTVNVTFPNGGEVLSGPSATFTWTAADLDGDALAYTVDYSADHGSTWETLAVGWNASNLPVDLSKLHGSNQALIRVTASDGFNCTADQSDGTFTVLDHAPTASISSPEDNRLYVGDQMVILEGTGADVEDGSLGDSGLSWASDLNGPLGKGTSLAINALTLQEGTHTITLTATDSAAQTGSASIHIRVFRTRPALPPALLAAPGELTFRLVAGQIAAQTVAIRNSGDGDLTWSASADQPWIQLSSGSGSTPYNLDITADATGLALGEYSGHVTIDAPGADDSPQVVTVNLIVQTDPVATVAAVSRKTHGSVGHFDIDLPLAGTPGIECRSDGATNDYQIVVTFADEVAVTGSPQAQVTAGSGTVGSGGMSNGGLVTVEGTTITVPLTNVANAQTINVTLFGVNGGGDLVIPMSLLGGDTNGNGSVDAGDVAQAKGQSGQAVTAANFREDVNANGSINVGDVALVKSHSGTSLP